MAAPSWRDAKAGRLGVERLEPREVPAVAAGLVAGGTLVVTGTGDDRIDVYTDGNNTVVTDRGRAVTTVPSASVTALSVTLGDGPNVLRVADEVTAQTTILGGPGRDVIRTGGGPTSVNAGAGDDQITVGAGAATIDGGGGADTIYRVTPSETLAADPADRVVRDVTITPPVGSQPDLPQATLAASDVDALLRRASAATASTDEIVAIVDRNGRILGVRVGAGVAPDIVNNPEKLTFAVDGAVALARTGAFFGNNESPLTSRVIQSISQSTITQREVDSDPNIPDPNSTDRGPGFVAAVGIKAHFPANVPNTPQVDLFQIEHTNRDGTIDPGPDHVRGTADDVTLQERFNIDPRFIPYSITGNGPASPTDPTMKRKDLYIPDSYGFVSGLFPNAQSRGIATLPGGVPIVKNGQQVGGIGVFFPGKTGYATEENSALSNTYDPNKPDRSAEAEWVAIAAVGGIRPVTPINNETPSLDVQLGNGLPVDDIGGVPLPAGIKGLPAGRIDLVGITLDIYGPLGLQGPDLVGRVGQAVGRGDPNGGRNLPVTAAGATTLGGQPVPDGYLVTPHDGNGITAKEVQQIIDSALAQANKTRAAIRLPAGTRAKFVFAVADRDGNIVGLYRQPDATIFSIDVAVAKARNVNYYADANKLQAVDQVPGVPAGTAFTNRTFRYLGQPRFPEAIDGAPPGPFSQLNDGGADPISGLQVGPRLPASAYQSVVGFDSFNPGTNFRDPTNVLNQNGIVFFPGSAPLYRNGGLIGGFGVSGDGVDQDDVTTFGGSQNFGVPLSILRSDQVRIRENVTLPYQKFNRNPEGLKMRG